MHLFYATGSFITPVVKTSKVYCCLCSTDSPQKPECTGAEHCHLLMTRSYLIGIRIAVVKLFFYLDSVVQEKRKCEEKKTAVDLSDRSSRWKHVVANSICASILSWKTKSQVVLNSITGASLTQATADQVNRKPLDLSTVRCVQGYFCWGCRGVRSLRSQRPTQSLVSPEKC